MKASTFTILVVALTGCCWSRQVKGDGKINVAQQQDQIAPQYNENHPAQARLGLPDFQPDADYLQESLVIDYIDSDQDPCLMHEKCLSGPGRRKILRFSTKVHNIGTADAHLGRPPAKHFSPNNPPYFHFDECHHHWHFIAYADYQLLNQNRQVILEGHKNGFCLEDLECQPGYFPKYDCNNQGISVGCADIYERELACQWIDITDLERKPGYTPYTPYILSVTINRRGFFPEVTTANNVAHATVVIANIPVRPPDLQGHISLPQGWLSPENSGNGPQNTHEL